MQSSAGNGCKLKPHNGNWPKTFLAAKSADMMSVIHKSHPASRQYDCSIAHTPRSSWRMDLFCDAFRTVLNMINTWSRSAGIESSPLYVGGVLVYHHALFFLRQGSVSASFKDQKGNRRSGHHGLALAALLWGGYRLWTGNMLGAYNWQNITANEKPRGRGLHLPRKIPRALDGAWLSPPGQRILRTVERYVGVPRHIVTLAAAGGGASHADRGRRSA